MVKESKTLKQPRSIEVKVLLPWALLALLLVGSLGYIKGWADRSENLGEVKREASVLIEGLVSKTEQR